MDLPRNWPEVGLLEDHPFENRNLSRKMVRPELAVLLAELDQDRTRLEDADRLSLRTVGIDDRRDLLVRADRGEFGLALPALADIDDVNVVRQLHLFEGHADLAAVRRVECVQL